MHITAGQAAASILEKLTFDLLSCLERAFDQMHPRQRISSIQVDQPSYVLAIGKNAFIQARALEQMYGDKILHTWIHQPIGYAISEEIPKFTVHLVEHPLPTTATFQVTTTTLQQIAQLPQGSRLLVLISGGGSAAFALPEIDWDRYLSTIDQAIRSGFDIRELNQVRSVLDRVKGGKLADLLKQLDVKAWITSDVPDDDTSVVASGPLSGGIELSPSVRKWLHESLGADVDNLIDKLPPLSELPIELLASRFQLYQALKDEIESAGQSVIIGPTDLFADMDSVVSIIADQSENIIIMGGEPRLVITSSMVQEGGRVSHLSCLIQPHLQDHIFVGIATDGQDGYSPEAGYVIDSDLPNIPQRVIENGSTGQFLYDQSHSLQLGQTHVNFMDMYLLIKK